MDPLEIPQLKEWAGASAELDPRSFIMANGTLADAKAISMIFWPEFVEYRNCIFVKFLFEPQGVDAWLERLKGDAKAVESAVNHLHLWDVFALRSDAERKAASSFCFEIASMWRAAVNAAFPGKDFSVLVTDEPDDYGPTLTLSSN
jgi:hypothetical protein